MCFLSIQSPIARLTSLYSRPSMSSGSVNGVFAPFIPSSSALSLPKMPSCPSTHTSWTELCVTSSLRRSRHSKINLRLDSHWFQGLQGSVVVSKYCDCPTIVALRDFFTYSCHYGKYLCLEDSGKGTQTKDQSGFTPKYTSPSVRASFGSVCIPDRSLT